MASRANASANGRNKKKTHQHLQLASQLQRTTALPQNRLTHNGVEKPQAPAPQVTFSPGRAKLQDPKALNLQSLSKSSIYTIV